LADISLVADGIVGRTPNVSGSFGTCPYPATVDDLWICASAGDLGGADSGSFTVGYATPYRVRPNGGVFIGLMAFNSNLQAELTDLLETVILHEMGHVVRVLLLGSTTPTRVISFSLFQYVQSSLASFHFLL
jgi:hypothetical protein